MLSVPNPSLYCMFVGQLISIIISQTVAKPLKLLLSIVYSSFSSFLALFVFFTGELIIPAGAFAPTIFPELPLLFCFCNFMPAIVGLF